MVCLTRPAALLSLALCGLACGDEALPFAPAGPDAAPDPALLGPYGVGVETVTVTDPRRFDPETRVPRTLTVEVWYPTLETGEGAVYPFQDFLPDAYDARAEGLGGFRTTAVRDAEIAEGPFPLVLFSHGSGGVRVQSTFLTVYLASHGFVVAAPDHVGNTLEEVLEAGSLDLSDLGQSLLDRPADLLAVLDDTLERHDIDEAHIGAVGHSFGAVTALRAAGMDPRIGAVVAQTPAGHLLTWIEIETPMEELGIPIMIQEGGTDGTTPPEMNARTFIPHMAPPGYYLSITRGGHFTYSDLCGLDFEVIVAADELISDVLTDGCAPEDITPEVALPMIRNFTIGLFNQHLRDSPSTQDYLLDPGELEDEATLQTWF